MNRFVFVLCVLLTITTASPLSWRVVGGDPAVEGQFPYQISIRIIGGTHNCGGSIINNRWILTSASCVAVWYPSSLNVTVGTIRLDDPSARIYQVERVVVHNGWDPIPFINDIGLLRVSEDIEFNDNVQPIPLNTEDIGGGADLILSGWGSTISSGGFSDTLQWIQLRSLTLEECLSFDWYVYLDDRQICTLTQEGEGACNGDYGSPLVSNGKLVGIVSYGIFCANGYPDIFTRVSSFVNWINQQIA